MVSYDYDAWGNLISVTGDTTLGNLNPLRYRGYYYDAETGFYYLQSRYYDPVTQRFINADSVISGTGESTQGYNLFAYCFNNPIAFSDETGSWPSLKKLWNAVKKTVAKIGEAIEKSFFVEAGVGVGYGNTIQTGNVKMSYGFYQDGYTGGYSDENEYTSVKISYGGSVSTSVVEIDLQGEIEHRHETNYKPLRDGHDAFSPFFELAKCHNSTHTPPSYLKITDLESLYSADDSSISFGASWHRGIGGHFQIGFNTKKFIEVLVT